MVQRVFDIIFSLFALLLFSIFLIPIVIILKFTGEGEIFFSQERVGKGGKLFPLLKFATMLKDSPNIGSGTVTLKDDPRVLPLGKFLRKTKINELPQLLNILKGDMSFIGPRPQAKRNFEAYSKEAQKEIKKVKPGISGIGSIFFRDEEEILSDENIDREKFYDDIIMPYKGELEIWYVKHQSLGLYFKLILLTLLIVLIPSYSIDFKKWFDKDIPNPPSELS
jgi:lipopolysaccharide/colanic/teichoic acid biosynthesis glycosyltransferase